MFNKQIVKLKHWLCHTHLPSVLSSSALQTMDPHIQWLITKCALRRIIAMECSSSSCWSCCPFSLLLFFLSFFLPQTRNYQYVLIVFTAFVADLINSLALCSSIRPCWHVSTAPPARCTRECADQVRISNATTTCSLCWPLWRRAAVASPQGWREPSRWRRKSSPAQSEWGVFSCLDEHAQNICVQCGCFKSDYHWFVSALHYS